MLPSSGFSVAHCVIKCIPEAVIITLVKTVLFILVSYAIRVAVTNLTFIDTVAPSVGVRENSSRTEEQPLIAVAFLARVGCGRRDCARLG